MIISRIRAHNVLKYRSLSIDLAEKGLIAISGHNESGKSSIGETVCFALFGRTFSIAPEDIQKVIRWGENHCDVTLEFSVEDRHYVLSRYLDRDANHSAKLAPADDPDGPIARGVQGVSEALFEILGFEFDEFVESFYLAQREITTPHPHSHAVKIMAGVAPLEKVGHSLREEIVEREELLGEIQAEWDAVDRDVQALGIQDGELPRLEEQRHQADGEIHRIDALVDELDAGIATYAANTSEVARSDGARGRMRFLRVVVLLLAVAAGATWGLLSYGAELPQAGQLRDLLGQYVSGWGERHVRWVGYAAAVLAVLFLLLWVRVAGLKRRIVELRQESAALTAVLGRARTIEIEDLPAETDDVADDSAIAATDDAPGDAAFDAHGLPVRPEYGEYEALCRLLDQDAATARMAREYGDREMAWLRSVAERLAVQREELDDEIDDERARLQEANNLADVLDNLSDKRAEVEERIAERHRGMELLDGAVAHLTGHFNRDVKDLVGRLLPLFTDGCYEHLQIDHGLKVRVFSSEKRDFMDLDEVSSGTQRQIMLALRLALSKKLLGRTVKGRQFAFLDEPFAFFDEERTRRALRALTDLGDDISQVWIVSQDFPDDCDVEFDTKVNCERASDTLEVAY